MVGATVSLSTGAISSLLPKLSALIDGEYKLLKGVKSGIKFLKDELSSMNALLVKLADNEEKLDGQVKDWRNKVRELSYDIEDCIDLFMVRLATGDAKSGLVKKTTSKIKKLWSRHKIANLIKDLKAQVQEESDRRWRYKFDESAVNFSTVQIDPRLPALFVEADRLIGIDGPREEIIEWLKKYDSEPQLKVVSIVGFGGLGKTTLASQVHHKIKGQFDCSCFVPVSQNPNIAKLLADMHRELWGSPNINDDERVLIRKLRDFLQNKRYLVIVDDIWSTQAWEFLKSALPENNLCSRVITTTRIATVAKSCCSSFEGCVYNIQPLSDQNSRKLFLNRIFGNVSACPSHLEQVLHAIIKKCHGLPLAIISIASLLAVKPNTKEQWEQVYNSIGSAFSQQGMRDILLLSYYDLPHHLKTCLLYLSMFPEDTVIQKEEIIWRWIAEGFIAEVRGQTIDQVAENYFNELVNRSMIQPIDVQWDGRAEACGVHDMVLEMIISLSTEQNFVSILEGQGQNIVGKNNIRRLSVQPRVRDEIMEEIMGRCSHIRSLSVYGDYHLVHHLAKLHSLRVLTFEDGYGYIDDDDEITEYFRGIFQLRYLRIRSGGVQLLEQIAYMQYLQTIDIRGSYCGYLPPAIGRLQNLVRLLVDERVELPNEIGDLQALQELSHAGEYDCINFLEQLGRLTRLRTLHITLQDRDDLDDHDVHDTERYMEAALSALAVMGKQLDSLIICCSDVLAEKLMDMLTHTVLSVQKLVIYGHFIRRRPKQMVPIVNLTHLDIGILGIKQEDLHILGAIPALLFIRLDLFYAPYERLTIRSQQFMCLKEFKFICSNVGGGLEMVCLQGAMPELRWLSLTFGALETVPGMGFEFGFEHLASLKHLSVTINCRFATRSRVSAAEAAVRNTVSNHPGHPTLAIKHVDKDEMDKDPHLYRTPHYPSHHYP